MAPIYGISPVGGVESRALPMVWNIDAQYKPGDIVPWHFMPGIIVASFFASLTGTLLTVELLHRKRLGKSIISRFVLKVDCYSHSRL